MHVLVSCAVVNSSQVSMACKNGFFLAHILYLEWTGLRPASKPWLCVLWSRPEEEPPLEACGDVEGRQRASENVLADMLLAKPGHMAKPPALGWREIIPKTPLTTGKHWKGPGISWGTQEQGRGVLGTMALQLVSTYYLPTVLKSLYLLLIETPQLSF